MAEFSIAHEFLYSIGELYIKGVIIFSIFAGIWKIKSKQ